MIILLIPGFRSQLARRKKTVLCFTQKIVAACGPVATLLLFLGVVAPKTVLFLGSSHKAQKRMVCM